MREERRWEDMEKEVEWIESTLIVIVDKHATLIRVIVCFKR